MIEEGGKGNRDEERRGGALELFSECFLYFFLLCRCQAKQGHELSPEITWSFFVAQQWCKVDPPMIICKIGSSPLHPRPFSPSFFLLGTTARCILHAKQKHGSKIAHSKRKWAKASRHPRKIPLEFLPVGVTHVSIATQTKLKQRETIKLDQMREWLQGNDVYFSMIFRIHCTQCIHCPRKREYL